MSTAPVTMESLADNYWKARHAHDEAAAKAALVAMDRLVDEAQDATEFAGVPIPQDVKKFCYIHPGSLEKRDGGTIWRGGWRLGDDSWYGLDTRLLGIGFHWEEACSDGFRAVWSRDADYVIVTYCEGDLSVTVDRDAEQYRSRLNGSRRYYERLR